MNEDGSIVEEPTNPMLEILKSKEPELYTNMESVHKTCLGKGKFKIIVLFWFNWYAFYISVQSDGDACDTAFEMISCVKHEGERVYKIIWHSLLHLILSWACYRVFFLFQIGLDKVFFT